MRFKIKDEYQNCSTTTLQNVSGLGSLLVDRTREVGGKIKLGCIWFETCLGCTTMAPKNEYLLVTPG